MVRLDESDYRLCFTATKSNSAPEELQFGNPLEVAQVVSNQDEVPLQCGRRDQYVGIANRLSLAAQLAPNMGESLHD